MGILRIILLLFVCLPLSATDYYVKVGGNDGLAGTSDATAWASISWVNSYWAAGNFAPGDNIYFKKGDTFTGTITVTESGTSGSPITIGAYGTGANPVITGFTTVSGWTSEGGGIYSKVISSGASRVETVSIDGVLTAMGRYPDEGSWLTITSADGNTSFTDASLLASPDWTGAEVVIRKYSYLVDRAIVDDHDNQTIYYTEKTGGSGEWGWGADNGYFFQADIRTLTSLGEWYYNGSTFYMYFGAVDPTTKVVKVATLENALLCVQDYIAIQDLLIEGYNSTGIEHYGGDYISFTNCEIRHIGGRVAILGSHVTFDECYIHDTHSNGLDIGGSNFSITDTHFKNISMLVGAGYGWSGQGYCIIGSEHTGLIEHCIFENIGYNGIFHNGNNLVIKNNFFDNCVARHYDGGAIYMTGHNTRTISDNIIVNIQGSINMIDNQTFGWYNTVEGIYLDEPVSNVTILRNSIYNIRGNGIKLHKAHDITVSNNIIANCVEGFQILNGVNQPLDPVRNLTISSNKIISYTDDQMFLLVYSAFDDINQFGTFANQIYSRPVDDSADEDWFTDDPADGDEYGNWRTFVEWKAIIESDASSSVSVVSTTTADNINFFYNNTKSSKIFTLSQPMVDLSNVSYSGQVSLTPYTSQVFIGEGTVLETPVSTVLPFKKINGKFGKINNRFIK